MIILAIADDPVAEVRAAHGGFDRILASAMGEHPSGYRAIDIRTQPLEFESAPSAIVISGSSSSVPDREPWMLRAEASLRALSARGVPMLGVCFGHQLLAQALGGQVQRNPRGREISTMTVERTGDDPLLEGLSRRFSANACHSDTVAILPDGAVALGHNAADDHQIVRFGPSRYGVQFHPEFDRAIMQGYVRARREAVTAEGLDADALERRAADTPEARRIFRRFLDLVG